MFPEFPAKVNGLAPLGLCRSAWPGRRAAERREQNELLCQLAVIGDRDNKSSVTRVSRGVTGHCDRLTNGHTLILAPLHPHYGQQGKETEEQE